MGESASHLKVESKEVHYMDAGNTSVGQGLCGGGGMSRQGWVMWAENAKSNQECGVSNGVTYITLWRRVDGGAGRS